MLARALTMYFAARGDKSVSFITKRIIYKVIILPKRRVNW